jgi:G3E family GTPase
LSDPLPVLLVTGALGAGKTTLINGVLGANHGRKLVAIVNDFGAINIDEIILSSDGHPVYGLKNGCICCSLQGDLLRTIRNIVSFGRPVDGIVIEASGVSDPRGIIEALHDPVLHQVVRLDSVVTVIDVEDHDSADPLWMAQVRAADMIVATKVRNAARCALASLNDLLEAMHKTIAFIADADAVVPFELLFTGLPRRRQSGGTSSFLFQADDRFVQFEWSSQKSVSLAKFQSAIECLTPRLLRAKGFLSFEERPGDCLLFQLVGKRASLAPASRAIAGVHLAFIGKVGLLDVDQAKAVLGSM